MEINMTCLRRSEFCDAMMSLDTGSDRALTEPVSFFGCQFVSFQLALVCAVYSSCDTLFGSSESSCAVIR